MAETGLHRHELVWLNPTAVAACTVAAGERSVFEAWVARKLPLVVGRQDKLSESLHLGFTLPGIGPRQRVQVGVSQGSVALHRQPFLLLELLEHMPSAWRPRLLNLIQDMEGLGLRVLAYGSLVTQAVSREACLRPDSDIDLLIDCRDRKEVEAALTVLKVYAESTPRIDGEIRLPGSHAVAWRELALVQARGGSMLVKSDTDLQLLGLEAFFASAACKEQ